MKFANKIADMKKITKYSLALALLCALNVTLLGDQHDSPNEPGGGGESVPDSGSTVALIALALTGTYLGSRFVKRNK
jgi:hypothetical protein